MRLTTRYFYELFWDGFTCGNSDPFSLCNTKEKINAICQFIGSKNEVNRCKTDALWKIVTITSWM